MAHGQIWSRVLSQSHQSLGSGEGMSCLLSTRCGTACLPARSKINRPGVVTAGHTLPPWFSVSPTLSLLICLFAVVSSCPYFPRELDGEVGKGGDIETEHSQVSFACLCRAFGRYTSTKRCYKQARRNISSEKVTFKDSLGLY